VFSAMQNLNPRRPKKPRRSRESLAAAGRRAVKQFRWAYPPRCQGRNRSRPSRSACLASKIGNRPKSLRKKDGVSDDPLTFYI